MMSSLPPGLRTRYISSSATRGREKFLNAARHTMKSNTSPGYGSSAASPWSKQTSTPAFSAFWLAINECFADIEPYHAAAGQPREFDDKVAGPGRDFEDARTGFDLRREALCRALKFPDVLGGLPRVPVGDKAFHTQPDVAVGRLGGVFGFFQHDFAPCKETELAGRGSDAAVLAERWLVD